jgi:hypothetical protein
MTLNRAIEIADLVVEHEKVVRRRLLRCFRASRCINNICLMANAANMAALFGISEQEITYFYQNYAASILS